MDVIIGKNRKGEVRTIPTFDADWSELKKLQYHAGVVSALGVAMVEVEQAAQGTYRVLVNGESVGALDYLDAAIEIHRLKENA